MVESKKALPKEPRLSFYSSYTSQYYGGQGGQLSPPGARNYYGPNPYQGMYMNGNRYYQHKSIVLDRTQGYSDARESEYYNTTSR